MSRITITVVMLVSVYRVIAQETQTSDLINLKGFFHLNSVGGLNVNKSDSYVITELEKGILADFDVEL